MTCSKDFGRRLQTGCLGLIGMLAVAAGCGGSETTPKKDGGPDKGLDAPLTPAFLTVSSTSLTLGTLDVGMPGTQSVIITNTGKATSGALSITTATPGLTTSGCSGQLLGGASCTLTITAQPTAVGAFSGLVSISATPGATSPLSVMVLATVSPEGVFVVKPATTFDFGSIALGEVKKQTLTVTARLNITDLTMVPNGADVKIDPTTTCTATLNANASCDIVVNFSAAASGAKNEALVISGGGTNGKVVNVVFAANVRAPAKLVSNPGAAQPFSAMLNTVSPAQSFNITNTGDITTGTVAINITGAASASFAIASNTCPAVLAGLASCTVSVVYKPVAATAAETAALTVTDSAAPTGTLTVALTGNPQPPSDLEISPTNTNLGSVQVGASGPATPFTITNKGGSASGPLTVTMSNDQVFTIANDTCTGNSLAANGTCTIAIVFKPIAPLATSGTLTVKGSSGNPLVQQFSGTGTQPQKLVATPPSVDFGSVRINNSSTPQTVTVKNTGDVATGALTLNKTGDFAAFPIVNNCAAALAPGATCTFIVTFSPTVAGSWNASYSVTDGVATLAPVTVTGTAQDATGITLAPGVLKGCLAGATPPTCIQDTVVGGSQDITLTVTAGATLPAGATDTGAITPKLQGANAADFVVKSTTCTSLLPSASCIIVVTFTPTAAGAREATVNVTTANGGVANATLQAKALPILGIYAITAAGATRPADTLSEKDADFNFGQVSLNKATGKTLNFRVIARGPTSAETPYPASTVTVDLVDPSTTGKNFSYAGGVGASNPCTGAKLTISDPAHAAVGSWTYEASYLGYFCDFSVVFLPQGTEKGEKTASLDAKGSATNGGTDTKAIKGTATGPLTITAAQVGVPLADSAFPASVAVGDSTNNGTTKTNLLLKVNNESTTLTLGPLAVAKTGDSFAVVSDTCTNKKLSPGTSCDLAIAFTPAAAGTQTGTITASAGAESSVPFDLSAVGSTGTITLTPEGTAAAPIDIASGTTTATPVLVGTSSEWRAFTVSNPANGAKTAQIGFSLTGAAAAKFEVNGTQGTNPCGATGTRQLNPGETCNVFVRFNPAITDTIGTAITATLNVTINGVGYTSVVSGTPASRLRVTSAQATQTVATGPNAGTYYDFGNAVSTDFTGNATFTIANLDPTAANAVTVELPAPAVIVPFSIPTGGTCPTPNASRQFSLAGNASCTIIMRMQGTGTAGSSYLKDVTFIDAAAGASSTAKVNVMGTTINPAALKAVGLDATTRPIDLGTVVNPNQSASAIIKIVNTGSVAATNLALTWTDPSGTLPPTGLLGDCAPTAAGDTCGPFVINTTETNSCWNKASLAPESTGAFCTVAIAAKPASSMTAGLKHGYLKVSADGGIDAGAVLSLTMTVRPATGASSQYFTYQSSATTTYGFLPFAATALNGNSDQVVVTLENKATSGTITLPATADAAGWAGFLSGPSLGDFVVEPVGTSACPATSMGPGSCTIGIKFHPVTAYVADGTNGQRFALLTVNGNTIGLSGTVKAPAQLVITPATLNFGEVGLGTSATLTATVVNNGDVEASAVSFVTSDATLFNVSGCGATVAPHATCNLSVVATPAAASSTAVTGSFIANFTGGELGGGATNSPANGPALTMVGLQSSALTITGVGATLVTVDSNRKEYTFGTAAAPIVVGSTPAVLKIAVTNGLNAQTTGVIGLAITGADAASFKLNGRPAAITTAGAVACQNADLTWVQLGPAGVCEAEITFDPANTAGTTTTGDRTAVLTLTATPGAATPKTVQFTGKTAPAVVFYDAVTAGNVLTSPVTVPAAANSIDIYVGRDPASTADMDLMTTAGISGDDAASFFISQNDCIFNSLVADRCLIRVEYIAAAPAAAKKTTLKVSDGTVGFTASIVVQRTP